MCNTFKNKEGEKAFQISYVSNSNLFQCKFISGFLDLKKKTLEFENFIRVGVDVIFILAGSKNVCFFNFYKYIWLFLWLLLPPPCSFFMEMLLI